MRWVHAAAAVLAPACVFVLAYSGDARVFAGCGGGAVPPPPPPAGDVPPDTREPADPPPPAEGGPPQTPGGSNPLGPETGDGGNPLGPQTGGGGSPAGPTSGGPSGGGGSPPTGGGSAPPTGPGTGGRRASSRSQLDRDDWTYWWYANRSELLDLHGRIRARTPQTAPGEHSRASQDELWRADAARTIALALTDREPEVVAAAAIALGRAGDPGEAPALTRLLQDRERRRDVRTASALALGLLTRSDDPASTVARAALRALSADAGESVELRAAATYALGLRGEAQSLPAIADLARTGGMRWDVPAAAVSALGLSAIPAARTDLEFLLAPPARGDDTDWMRRVYAAHGLARLGDRDGVPALIAAAADADEQVRRAALLALGRIAERGDRAVLALLLETLRADGDPASRNIAALSLGRIAHPDAVAALRRAYKGGDAVHRPYAVLGLGLAGRSGDLPEVRALIREDLKESARIELRRALCISAGLSRATECAATLREIVAEPCDPSLRGHAATSLGLLGDTASAPAIRNMLAETWNPDVIEEAALALGLLGDREATPILVRQVRDGSTRPARVAAAVALGRMGGAPTARLFAEILAEPDAPAAARVAAATGMGVLLDRRGGRGLADIGADLNWYATTETVREILAID